MKSTISFMLAMTLMSFTVFEKKKMNVWLIGDPAMLRMSGTIA
jgi:hypothetical protein